MTETPPPSSSTPPHTATTAQPATAPAMSVPAQITIEDFMKIQLKTAKVLSAERVPKSEKLLKLQVSVGAEQRQIVAGIGKRYEPDALIGKTIVIVNGTAEVGGLIARVGQRMLGSVSKMMMDRFFNCLQSKSGS